MANHKTSKYRLGIDLGGTSAKLAVVANKNQIIWEESISSAGFPGPKNLIKKISESCRPILKKYKINRVGVGVAGDIDFDRGIVRVSPNLGWKNIPLKKMIQATLHCPVVVDNDANVAAWGIYQTQVHNKIRNLLVVTLGTGVGGGVILEGQLYRGATGSAGEIGHMTMDEQGRLCNCGNRGCLETVAGGTHLVKKVKEALIRGEKSRLRTIFLNNQDDITPYTVAQAAEAGDLFAKRIWNEVGHTLGVALGNLIYVFNPQAIYLTGGVAQARGLILKPLKETLHHRAFKTPINAVKIAVAEEAPYIGVLGASLL